MTQCDNKVAHTDNKPDLGNSEVKAFSIHGDTWGIVKGERARGKRGIDATTQQICLFSEDLSIS